MKSCPVTRDLNAHLGQIDDACALEIRAEQIAAGYSPDEAREIIADWFGENGGKALINILGKVAVSRGTDKVKSVVVLHKELARILEAAATIQAKGEIE